MVTGVNQFARNMGGILGLSIAGAIFSAGVSAVSSRGIDPNQLLTASGSSVSPADLPFVQGVLAGSLHAVFLLMAAAALLAGLAAALLPAGRLRGQRRPPADTAASEPELALTG